MKKFYISILATVLLFISSNLWAQTYTTTYITVADDGFSHLISDPASFIGLAPPPNCTSCLIVVNCQMVMDNTTPSPSLTASKIEIEPGASFTVDTYVQLFDSQVIIGDGATGGASVIVNDQVDLNGTSNIHLANDQSFIDTRNLAGNPISGPHDDYSNPGFPTAGIFYIRFGDPDGYDVVLGPNYYGNVNYNQGFYTLNCSPNPCGGGLVNGPAYIVYDAGNDIYSFAQGPILPVVLVQLIASRNDDQSVAVSWSTSQEVNSSYFDVERSADLGTWVTLGSVKARGFSSVTQNYTYTDQYPLSGTGYYRLKMVDLDGKFLYSKVVSVSSNGKTESLVVYNNPFSDQIRFKVNLPSSDILSLTVTDMMGKTYLHQSYSAQPGDNYINLIPGNTAQGLYILHIKGARYDRTVKLVKQ